MTRAFGPAAGSPAARMRCGALILALALTWFPSPGAAESDAADLAARRIDRFSARGADGARLRFLGGIVVRGARGFGAFSGLLVDGERLLAASDTGNWLAARLTLDAERLRGLREGRLRRRTGRLGVPVKTKREGDAEALAHAPGAVLVLVEATREILSYPADGLLPRPDAAPERIPLSAPERRAMRGGVEALAQLPSGELLVIAEGRTGTARETPAFIVGGRRFAVARRDGFAITGAAALPGGDVIIVERRYGGGIDLAMRVRRLGADLLRAGGPADGPVLMEAGFAAEIDNMEGIAAEVRGGTIILTLVSDDNLSFWQRTLLLRFAVTDPLPRRNPRRAPSVR